MTGTRPSGQTWIVINFKEDNRFECLRCGQHYTPKWPCPVYIVIAISKAFERHHRGCTAR